MSSVPSSSQQIESLMKLKDGEAKGGKRYFVYAVVYNKNLVGKEGKADDEHGLVIILDACDTGEEAADSARREIERTGYKGINVVAARKFDRLSPVGGKVHEVIIDASSGKISEYQKDLWKEEEAMKKREEQLRKEIEAEIAEEKDPDSIEAYKRDVIVAIQNLKIAREFEAKAAEMREKYTERMKAGSAKLSKHPEFSDKLLPYLKEKLTARKESALYDIYAGEYPTILSRMKGMFSTKSPPASIPTAPLSSSAISTALTSIPSPAPISSEKHDILSSSRLPSISSDKHTASSLSTTSFPSTPSSTTSTGYSSGTPSSSGYSSGTPTAMLPTISPLSPSSIGYSAPTGTSLPFSSQYQQSPFTPSTGFSLGGTKQTTPLRISATAK